MSINKMQYNASDILNYPANHHNPTTQTNYANNVKNWVETEKHLVDCLLWQPTTAYRVGNMVKTPSLPSQYCLVCTTAGTSGNSEPDYTNVSQGDSVTDGTVTWNSHSIVNEQARRGTKTGNIAGSDTENHASVGLTAGTWLVFAEVRGNASRYSCTLEIQCNNVNYASITDEKAIAIIAVSSNQHAYARVTNTGSGIVSFTSRITAQKLSDYTTIAQV